MKHESKKQVEEIIMEYTCDICGKPASGRKCHICTIDICEQHTHREPDKWGGDYSDKFCIECWEIGKPFREKMEEVENRLYNEVGNINKEWKIMAIDNRKKKLGTKNGQ